LTITRLLYTPIAGLILSNLYGQYYYATTVPAGNPEVVVEEVKREAPWMITKAKGAINASDEQVVFADGTWGGDRLRKCGNCSGPKPLVSSVQNFHGDEPVLIDPLLSERITVKYAEVVS
jgi:hypothetical protein